MILRGIDFGSAWMGSGAGGFFGEGYWFHPLYRKLFGKRFCPEEFTLVAKTTTLNSRRGKKHNEEGNAELAEDGISLVRRFPGCITVGLEGFMRGYMLNAVGLSGPGAPDLFARMRWQEIHKPFFLSFMSLEKDDKAIQEMEVFKDLLAGQLFSFRSKIGLQINLSCPNAHVDLASAARNACTALDIFAELGIPLVPKFNVLVPVDLVCRIAEHPACDAVLVSNTIPWGKHERIKWSRLFGGHGVSPLEKYGGGGLSGAPLLPLVCDWVAAAKEAGISKPINAGGGILHPRDVDRVKDAGADGISVASAFAIRPWNTKAIVRRAYEVFDHQQERRR